MQVASAGIWCMNKTKLHFNTVLRTVEMSKAFWRAEKIVHPLIPKTVNIFVTMIVSPRRCVLFRPFAGLFLSFPV